MNQSVGSRSYYTFEKHICRHHEQKWTVQWWRWHYGAKFIKKDSSVQKKTYELKLHLDSAQGYYLSRVGLNMHELTTGEYTVVFELYFPSASIAGLFIC